MRTKTFFGFLASAALVLAGCNQKEEMEPTYDPGVVTFSVASQVISDHGIDVFVQHDGDKMDGWCGFLTEDLTTDINVLINTHAAGVTAADMHYGKTQTVRFTDLEAEKDYRYIAYGLKDNKTLYGIPGYAAFTTAEDFNIVVFSVETVSVTGHEAEFNVSHTGKETYSWYAFVTEDLTSDISALCSAQAGKIDFFNYGTPVKTSLSDLAADTEYRYIVFGVKEGGVMYGTPASVTFATPEDWDGIKFNIVGTRIDKTSATFEVSHNGREDYNWFDFITDDLSSSVADLVSAKLGEISAADVKSGKKAETSVKGLMQNTTYRYVVAGYKDGETYGVPGNFEFTTQEYVATPYEKWLGKWESVGSDGTKMTFTITKKVTDQSYYISGFSDLIDPVEADFDVNTGELLLKFFQSTKTLNLSSGVFTLYIAGLADTDYDGATLVAKGDANGVIAAVQLTSNTTAVAPNYEYDYSYSDAGLVHHWVSWIGMFGQNNSTGGWTYFSDLDYIYFPANWTKTEDGAGEDDEELLKEYTKWLGDWTTTRQNRVWNATTETWDFDGEQLTDTWKIAEKEKGVSYFITGVNGRTYPVEAFLNPSDGSFTIKAQQNIGKIKFSSRDHDCDVHLYGIILHTDGKNYRITPGDDPYTICTVKAASATQANIVPNTVSTTSLGSNPLTGMRIFATDPEDGSVLTISNNYWTNLPNTLKKVSGSGAPKRELNCVETVSLSPVSSVAVPVVSYADGYGVAPLFTVTR